MSRLALLATLAGAFLVRVLLLGRAEMWADEVHTFQYLSLGLAEGVGERLAAGQVPLYFLLVKGWSGLFGTSAFALRLPSALLGTALLLPLGGLARRLGGESAGRYALLIAAFHPLLVGLSREARMYPLLLLLWLVAAHAIVRADDEGSVPKRLWPALLLGPAVHPTWGFALLPLLLFSLTVRKAVRRPIVLGLIGSALLLALLLLGATGQRPDLVRRSLGREVGVFVIRLFAGEGVRDAWLAAYVALLATWAVPLGLGLVRAGTRERRFALLTLLAPIAASVLAGVAFGFAYGPVRYVHTAAVGLVLLAARGMVEWPFGRVLLLVVPASLGVWFAISLSGG